MSGSKHFDIIAIIITAFTLVLTILFMSGVAQGLEDTAHTMGYENKIFDNTKVHTIDIVMDEWDDMIDNASSEEYYIANVVIDNELYKYVGIRTKGNTSLSTVATLGSERYSFKIEFDHYDSTKSYYGLDKLSLNNLIQDSTMMKDYLTYTMMNEFNVNSPLCSYVYITVNGEAWGLYLAVEGVEEAFLERNNGSNYGNLYKPDSQSMGGGRGNGHEFDMSNFNSDFGDAHVGFSDGSSSFDGVDSPSEFGSKISDMPIFDNSEIPDGSIPSDIPEDFDPSGMFGSDNKNPDSNFVHNFGISSSDVKLQYIDDNLDSYSNIWDNAKTDITETDQYRLIESLQKLSNNEDIESVVDIEQVIRYFVVHNYVCNGDSYTGSMIHNYYLYEKDGQLAMIPWDYNLAFGTFQGNNANSTVNTPIDSPIDSGSSDDRPMWNWIVENEEYLRMYHQYFSEFLNTVDIQGIINNAQQLIKEYVSKDPTSFYTYDEFEAGVETLQQFCMLRSESISMQLENGETSEIMNYVNASDINLSTMGSMDNHADRSIDSLDKNFQISFGNTDNNGNMTADNRHAAQNRTNDMPLNPDSPDSFDTDNADVHTPPEKPNGTKDNVPNGPGGFGDFGASGEFTPSVPDTGFNGSSFEQSSDDSEQSFPNSEHTLTDKSDSSNNDITTRPSDSGMQMPGGKIFQNANSSMSSTPSTHNHAQWILLAVSLAILIIGLIVAKLYKA